ncbi:hypothetical protein PCYB_004430 [Plasmodium cynomolgi strain B]|uniref:CYIR protein n=1 Tax=Plasmodium cynomolgi (strain B) TaxID=1120755 RepID=K6V081_PLACD|nr:hypothetical protein PCYB_004430 [Plasmodium cynomolgi strain B]GAB69694.1 hypothetical protein PCYB_004430 [Plasmodium cynomolgi strain B]
MTPEFRLMLLLAIFCFPFKSIKATKHSTNIIFSGITSFIKNIGGTFSKFSSYKGYKKFCCYKRFKKSRNSSKRNGSTRTGIRFETWKTFDLPK